jgi:hypothetical protein
MQSYYFPCLHLSPEDGLQKVDLPTASLHLREWEISTFDFATLGSKHKLHFSWHLLEVLMHSCNLEIEIKDAKDISEAHIHASKLQAMLYLNGAPPFIMPFALTRPMRDYSGLNFRDSDALRSKLPEQLKSGFCSADGQIEGWLHEPSLKLIAIPTDSQVTGSQFMQAVEDFASWSQLEAQKPNLRVARLAMQTAPMIPDLGSSLLHIWQGIEALFPKVSSEVSFRLSLYVAQLCIPVQATRLETYQRARRGYTLRSDAAHGRGDKVDLKGWPDAWFLLRLCLSACLRRKTLHSEELLTEELLK